MELEALKEKLAYLGLVEHTGYFVNDVEKKHCTYFTLPLLLSDNFSYVCRIQHESKSGHNYFEMWSYKRISLDELVPDEAEICTRIDFLTLEDEEKMNKVVDGIKKLIRQIRKEKIAEL